MKFVVVLVTIISYTLANQPLVHPALECNTTTGTSTTTCGGCMNLPATSGMLPKQINSSNNLCATLTNTISNCEVYNPAITATKAQTDCIRCSTKWMNITKTGTNNWTVACGTQDLEGADATISGCNAAKGYASYKIDTATANAFCRFCDGGKKWTGAVANVGGTGCGAVINDCAWTDPIGSGDKCYECTAKWVKGDDGTCSDGAAIPDPNCRKADSGNAFCRACRDGMYFDGKYCRDGNYSSAANTPTGNNCMGQYPNVSDKCFTCQNLGLRAKAFAPNTITCVARTAGVRGCKYYKGQSENTLAVDSCIECQNNTWQNIKSATIQECAENPFGLKTGTNSCQAIANCDQNVCVQTATTPVYTAYCKKCKHGYYPSGTPAPLYGSTACDNQTGSVIQHCSWYDPFEDNPKRCYLCDSGYIVAKDYSCEPVSSYDPNCRMKDHAGVHCYECKPGFRVNNAACEAQESSPAVGTPATTLKCLGSIDNVTDKCSACFNAHHDTDVSTDLKHKAFNPADGDCGNVTNNGGGARVLNCKSYWGWFAADQKNVQNCNSCYEKEWLKISDNKDHATINITCVDDPSETNCTRNLFVENCMQNICYGFGGTWATGCKWCMPGYKGSGELNPNAGYTTCVAQTLANCVIAHPYNNTKCWECAPGYVVAANELSCVTQTTQDSGCRKKGSGDWCGECKTDYLVNNTGSCEYKVPAGYFQFNSPATKYCKSTNATGGCTTCYNWGSTAPQPKRLDGTNCVDLGGNDLVAHCKWYRDNINTALAADKGKFHCMECDGKTWLNVSKSSGGAHTMECSNTALTGCSGTINNCAQHGCLSIDSASGTKFCIKCNPGFYGSGTAVDTGYFSECADTARTTNPPGCVQYSMTTTTTCIECAAGKVLTASGKNCVAYTADPGCVQLSVWGWCAKCKNGFFLNGYVCQQGYSTAQGEPAGASLCMGNVDNAKTCSACKNSGTDARQLSAGTCTGKVANPVEHCKWYNGRITNNRKFNDCGQCDTKLYLNIIWNDNPSLMSIKCEATGVPDTSVCTATPLDNCAQMGCYQDQGGTKYKVCVLCNPGYKGLTQRDSKYFATCTDTAIINGCSVGHPLDAAKCYLCDANKAVSFDGTACTSYTDDANCRALSLGNWCAECKNTYYFNGKTCALTHSTGGSGTGSGTASAASNVMIIPSLILALLFFFN